MRFALDPAMLKARPVEAALRAAAEAGYGFVELGNRDDLIPAFDAVGVSPTDLRRTRLAARQAGVEIVSVAVIQAWSSPDEDVRAQAVSWWQDGIAAVVALGCTRINSELSGSPSRPDDCRAAFLRSVETLLPVLEREGIEIVVEPHPGDFIETTAGAVDLVRSIGSSRIRYLHCVPHTYYLGGTASDQIEYARGWFDHVHLADTYRPERTIVNPPALTNRVHQHFDIGRGELDWAEIGRALRLTAFDGTLTVQVFGWDEQAEKSFVVDLAAVERLFGQTDGTGER
jgi:myo-inositol catabolism protein IolH